ncbi:hypothetical protein [Paenibacillus wynnii]|uniref:hypothetical protein n=1 Tax=Paenibacillus wynnii TaxID=268407 RepID=UPI00278CE100|nr:hypothetical protein [Paenibacillus wynnii]MDQ0191853.1 flagellar biosynthesis GTPase FlhF [Paenibacillus wynnii]
MWMAIGLLSFLACIVLVVLGLISLIKKKPNKKKLFLSSVACFVIFIIAIAASPTTETGTANNSDEAVTAVGEVSTVNADTQDDADAKAKKEADKKAKQEAEDKAAADKKAKEDAEAKAQAEADAKAAAEAKELEKKSHASKVMETVVPFITEDMAELDDSTKKYLIEHNELFPATTVESKNAAIAEVDPNITSRHLFKNITPYLTKMIEISGDVVQISEEETDFGTLATVHILNDNGDSIIGIYNGSTGDILDGDYVVLRGVPTASYSFANVSGGTTNAILLTLSTINKSQ